MVESAPQDRKRLAPNMAKPIDPMMKAKKPICGEKPPSRAVAICSGIAMAASVNPAIRSPGRSPARNERSERKMGQWLWGLLEAICTIDGLQSDSPSVRRICGCPDVVREEVGKRVERPVLERNEGQRSCGPRQFNWQSLEQPVLGR